MSKRKVNFDDGVDISMLEGSSAEKSRKGQAKKVAERASRFKGNHTLDSDEEDENKDLDESNVLDDEDIEGNFLHIYTYLHKKYSKPLL